jgi:hypothetical protein
MKSQKKKKVPVMKISTRGEMTKAMQKMLHKKNVSDL